MSAKYRGSILTTFFGCTLCEDMCTVFVCNAIYVPFVLLLKLRFVSSEIVPARNERSVDVH